MEEMKQPENGKKELEKRQEAELSKEDPEKSSGLSFKSKAILLTAGVLLAGAAIAVIGVLLKTFLAGIAAGLVIFLIFFIYVKTRE